MEANSKPASTLDFAKELVNFARTLSDDADLISQALMLGYQAVGSDRQALKKGSLASS
jgi:hypothetical protein